MGLLIFILVVLVVLSLALYAAKLMPGDAQMIRLIQLICIVIAVVVIAQRAGVV